MFLFLFYSNCVLSFPGLEIILDFLDNLKCHHMYPYRREGDSTHREGDVKREMMEYKPKMLTNAGCHQKLEDTKNGFSPNLWKEIILPTP